MTARTSAYDPQTRDGIYVDYPVIAAEIIYKGTPIFKRAASGHVFSNDGTTNSLAVGDQFVGIADETVDNSAGAAADKNVRVRTSGLFNLPLSGTVTQAKSGDPVFVNETSDDSTATLTSDLSVLEVCIGELVQYVDSDNGLVCIDGKVGALVGYGAVLPKIYTEGRTCVKVAKASYSYAVDGGAIGNISLGVVIPSGAVILGGAMHVTTTVEGAGADALITLESSGDIIADAGLEGAPWSSTGFKDLVQDGSGSTMIKTTADRTVTLTVQDAVLTAGVFDLYLMYVI